MLAVTLQEAKAKLNHLVEQARRGRSVVLMRGSKVVATILPLSERDLEIQPHLTDAQATRFWDEIGGEKQKKFKGTRQAIGYLKRLK